MTQAFYSGISGVKAHSESINIVSDNIANISTVGYRGNGYEFSSLFADQLTLSNEVTSTVDNTIGLGTRVNATPMMQGSGSEILSDRSTDLAILGDGWFGIQGKDEPMYTRDGSFSFDSNDNLVTQDGFHVLGTMGGNIKDNVLTKTLAEVPLSGTAAQEKLRFPKSLTFPPKPTTEAKFKGNVGTKENVITMGASVIDGQSNKNDLRLEFTRSAVQTPPGVQWDVKATTQSLDGSTVYDTQSGVVNFDEKGSLVSSTLTSIDNNGTPVKINLGAGFDGVVALSNIAPYSSSSSDGTIGGDLQGYDINKNGEVIATFTNGEQSSVGKIAVYHFMNDQGLERINGSRFRESSNSGKPTFFQDASGKNIIGTDITNFKLEGSNISMEYGLTELIILQRSYDASAKSITTADQMMQKALNMDA